MTRDEYSPVIFAASASVTAAFLGLLTHNAVCVGVAALAGAVVGFVVGAICAAGAER